MKKRVLYRDPRYRLGDVKETSIIPKPSEIWESKGLIIAVVGLGLIAYIMLRGNR